MRWIWVAVAIAIAAVIGVTGYVMMTSGKDAIIGYFMQNKDQVKDKDFVSGNGTITLLTFEGGFYGIITDDGKHYDPTNLSPEYQIEGMKIYFEGKKLEIVTIHMWGTPIQITKIQRND
jgi:hypothetical protein